MALTVTQMRDAILEYIVEGVPDADEQALALNYLNRGYERFLNAQSPETGEFHQWSFLQALGSITLVANDGEYDMPSDYGGRTSPFVRSDGTQLQPAAPVEYMRLAGEMAGQASQPRYFNITPKAFSASTAQRWAVRFLPVPAEADTLQYSYRINPGSLSLSDTHTIGGPQYAEAILACGMAAAELAEEKAPGSLEGRAQQALAAAIRMDSATTGQDEVPEESLYDYPNGL